MSEVFEAHLQNMVFNKALLLESLFDNETDLLLAVTSFYFKENDKNQRTSIWSLLHIWHANYQAKLPLILLQTECRLN